MTGESGLQGYDINVRYIVYSISVVDLKQYNRYVKTLILDLISDIYDRIIAALKLLSIYYYDSIYFLQACLTCLRLDVYLMVHFLKTP